MHKIELLQQQVDAKDAVIAAKAILKIKIKRIECSTIAESDLDK